MADWSGLWQTILVLVLAVVLVLFVVAVLVSLPTARH